MAIDRSAVPLLAVGLLLCSSPWAAQNNPVSSAGDNAKDEVSSVAGPSSSYAFGLGWAQVPRWMGANGQRSFEIPYININWQDRIQFSTTDGLIVDFLHNGPWHGGVVGTMIWGRSGRNLGPLAEHVPTYGNSLQGGVYLEYEVTKKLSVGARLRHDLQNTSAAYGDVYADLDLPTPGLLEHSVRVAFETMNGPAMRRYFGLRQDTATALGVSAYEPNGGYSQFSVLYEAFVPTSKSTGIALAADYSRLSHAVADSPLVRDFGSANQRSLSAALVYHF